MPQITRAQLDDLLASYRERGTDPPARLLDLETTFRAADYRLPDGEMVRAQELAVIPPVPPDDELVDTLPF